MRSTTFIVLATTTLASLSACLGDEAKGEEEELLDDTKADSHRLPTNHGPLAFGEPGISALTATERYHAWTFELSGPAILDMRTSYALLGQRRTDTVLYLYRETATGWGPYIARNDDYDNTTYSKLERELSTGRYRVLVKGHLATTLGKFKVTVNCDGPGCAPPDPEGCLFGQVYQDIFTSPALEVVGQLEITAANLADFSAADHDRIVRAVQESSHTDVTTAAEALERVDQNEINYTVIADSAGRRTFVAFEYGAGDNSYGAVFNRNSSERATSIHDGDLYNCSVQHETCLLPADWLQLRNSSAFSKTPVRVITAASQLSTIEAQQALGAFRQSYDDVTSVADGLSRVDGNQLNVQTYTHLATSKQVVVFEYGAGDTSVGAIYTPNTTQLAGVINDLAIENCALFQ